MEKESAAHFEQVKMQNWKIIRNRLRTESPQGITKLAEKLKLSYPTVAALLKEMINIGEVQPLNEMKICGGRPGMRYELNAAYQYAFAMYFSGWTLKGTVYDSYGRSVEKLVLPVSKDTDVDDIILFARRVKEKYVDLTAAILGIPGAVNGNKITYLPRYPKLEGEQLAELIRKEITTEFFIENDINTAALAEVDRWKNFAHVAFLDDCIGAGIVLDGSVVKGSRGYAGELAYLCEDEKGRENTFVKSILALVCVLDLPDVVISGENITQETADHVKKALERILPEGRAPRIYVSENMTDLYEDGLRKRILLSWSDKV